jgi:hypothetical protein
LHGNSCLDSIQLLAQFLHSFALLKQHCSIAEDEGYCIIKWHRIPVGITLHVIANAISANIPACNISFASSAGSPADWCTPTA